MEAWPAALLAWLNPYIKTTKLRTTDNTLWCTLCRERKRTKVDSLEGDVSALEAQIADLRVRQAENADLEQQNRCVLGAARSAVCVWSMALVTTH
jgi:hypothetical protein